MFKCLFVCRPLEDTISHRFAWAPYRNWTHPMTGKGGKSSRGNNHQNTQWGWDRKQQRQQGMGQHKCTSQTSLSFLRSSPAWVLQCRTQRWSDTVMDSTFLEGQTEASSFSKVPAQAPWCWWSHSSSGLAHDMAVRATRVWGKPSQVFHAAQWPSKAAKHFRVLAAGLAIHSILCYIFGNIEEKGQRMSLKGDILTWHPRMSQKSPGIPVFWDKSTKSSSTARMPRQRKVLINCIARQWLGKKKKQPSTQE